MCYSPVLMRSNARYKNLGYKTFNFVPCGECFQCRSQKAESYFIRAFNEFQLYNDPNCIIMFVLLTYNERFLPRVSNDVLDYVGDGDSSEKFHYRLNWNYSCNGYWYDQIDDPVKVKKRRVSKNCPWDDQLGDLCNVDFKPLPTFSTDDVDKFFKKIRSGFIRHLGYVPNISYLLVAENGDKRQRPHYHLILLIDLRKSFYHLIKSIVINAWTCRVQEEHFVPYLNKDGSYKRVHRDGSPYGYLCKTKTYPRGLVMFDEDHGRNIIDPNDPHVARYLSQYVTTDPYFDSLHAENLMQLSSVNQRIYRKKFGPFRLTSQFFGISALWNNSVNLDTGKIFINDSCGYTRDLPLYYYRYTYFSKDSSGRFVRNSNYTKLLLNRMNDRYEKMLLEFRRFMYHYEHDLFHPHMYDVYQNYVNLGMCKHTIPDYMFYYHDIDITAERLLGYYLIYFLVPKYSTHGNFEKCPLPYLDRCHYDSTFKMLDNKQYVLDRLSDLIEYQESASLIGDDKLINDDILYQPMRVYDSFCIMFSVWLKFDLVSVNINKFNDWNEKAKSLGKAKYLARPHALKQL